MSWWITVGLVAGVVTVGLSGNVSTWVATEEADWSMPANWSSGVPTGTTIAEVGIDGDAVITTPGATCAELRIGLGGESGDVSLEGGGLSVTGDLLVGHQWVGAFHGLEGALNVGGDFRVTGFGAASFGSADPFSVSVAGLLDVTLLLVIAGSDATISTGTFAMGNAANLEVVFLAGTVAPRIDVTGSASIDGELSILDPLNVPDGTYEIIRAASVSGTFDTTDFPDPAWSWMTNGSSVFIIKGDDTPVETRTWGGIKASFRSGQLR